MFQVVVFIGFILRKYANGSDSLDPNLDCRVSCNALLVSRVNVPDLNVIFAKK